MGKRVDYYVMATRNALQVWFDLQELCLDSYLVLALGKLS